MPKRKKFDPKGSGYDYKTAGKSKMKRTKGHMGSRDPETGLILKGEKHPSWDKMVAGEKKAGYRLHKLKSGRWKSTKIQGSR